MRRAFLALFLLACDRPTKIAKADEDATPVNVPVPDPTPAPPAPLRALPRGEWWTQDHARVTVRLDDRRATLTEHLAHERAPLIASGKVTSTMERDGTFVVEVSVDTLERKFLSRCLDCKSKDVHEVLTVAAFDGQEITKGGVVRLTVKFSEDDRVAEMCFTATKKCEVLKRG